MKIAVNMFASTLDIVRSVSSSSDAASHRYLKERERTKSHHAFRTVEDVVHDKAAMRQGQEKRVQLGAHITLESGEVAQQGKSN
jgi:hypothetical protein